MCGNEVTTKLDEGENYAIMSSVKACNYKSIAEFLSSENSQLFLILHVFAKLCNLGISCFGRNLSYFIPYKLTFTS